MKKIYLLFSFSLFFGVSAQTLQQRLEIQKHSNPEVIAQLKQKIEQKAKVFSMMNRLSPSFLQPQRFVDGRPIYFATDNFFSVRTLRAETMYPGGTLGINATGQELFAGVWDGGKVLNTHQEFTSRVILGDVASTLSTHATHVTGTICAQGVSPSRKGFAYQAYVRAYDWNGDETEMFGFATDGFLVSNHSYGNIASSLQEYYFGNYNAQSIEADDLMNTFPYYQIVKSAGNDRSTFTINQVNNKGGYDLLTGVATAKNVLTVAAVGQVTSYTSPASVEMSSFSNWGPTDDGRVKPDISAMGVDVSSCSSSSNTAYTALSGTSMASPAITGLIVLLQDYYNDLNAQFMRSATVRGLLCQSAREAGDNPGPDYSFGWGLADGYNASNVIKNNGTSTLIEENTLLNGATYTKNIQINTTQDINVVVSWTDPTGTANQTNDVDNRSPRLRNNLDLKILKDGTTYYPWKLDPEFPTDAATNTADNNVDNIEKVQIFNATPGVYTIQVTHKGSLQGGSQDYSLIASATTGLALGLNTIQDDNTFFVYPSPASNEIHFNNPKEFSLDNVAIYDVSGKLVVESSKVMNNTLDVSALQSGVYMVKINSQGVSFMRKFTKN